MKKSCLLLLTIALCCTLLMGCDILPFGNDNNAHTDSENVGSGNEGSENKSDGNSEHTHSYIETVTTPTCTAEGYTTHTCSCGDSYTDNKVNALGHNYETNVTLPTYEKQGYTTYTCECGHSYVGDYTEPLTPSIGLEYELAPTYYSTKGYVVSGIGNCEDSDIVIPKTYDGLPVIEIGNGAFADYDKLISIIIPDSVTTIEQAAFWNCHNLTSITIPKSITSISIQVFAGCTKLVEIINHSELDIKVGSSDYGSIAYHAIEVHTGSSKIVNWNDYLFYTYNNVNYLLGYVGNNTELTLPNDYSGDSYKIYNYAFNNCSNLASINVPCTVTSIGDYAFNNCSNLTSISIGSGITNVGTDAFKNCSGITGVYIEDISSWCKVIFETVYSNPLRYAKELYLNNELLINLIMPDGVTSISNYAFYNCLGLTNITIPNSVTSIGDYAFSRCSSLASVTIGNGVTSIGNFAFYGCSSLSNIDVSRENTAYQSIDGNLYTKDAKTLIQYAIGKTDTSFTIPDSVTSIGDYAFYDDSLPRTLTSVTIHDSVTSIGVRTFDYCLEIKSIHFDGTIEQWNAIGKGIYWNSNTGNYTIYCTDGEIAKDGTVTYY